MKNLVVKPCEFFEGTAIYFRILPEGYEKMSKVNRANVRKLLKEEGLSGIYNSEEEAVQKLEEHAARHA